MVAQVESTNPMAGDMFGPVFDVATPDTAPQMAIICEHASNHIPASLNGLGLSGEIAQSHIAWDPGALGVAKALAERTQSLLIAGRISRLVYDCNRPPDAPSAIPERSEIYDIPGNRGLSPAQRAARIEGVFQPFSDAVTAQIAMHRTALQSMVTIHSFTPVFFDNPREVEVGILHGQDTRLAEAMMANRPTASGHDIRLNEPYAAKDGVAHTLDEHGARNGLPNVMIEIRNDLIQTPQAQAEMAALLADWIASAMEAHP